MKSEIYKSLFKNSYSVMLIIHPKSGNIIDANLAACHFYGYEKSVLTTMKIQQINMLSEENVQKEMQNAELENRNYFIFRHKLANGKIKDVEVFSGPIVINQKKLLYSIIHDISHRLKVEKEREALILELQKTLKKVKQLSGLLPICASCKNIRDDSGYWKQIESYIREHSEAEFSHSICPDCFKKLYPELETLKKENHE